MDKSGPSRKTIIGWTAVMCAALGLAVAGGILWKPLHLRYSYWRLRNDPGYTRSFMSHGQDAVRYLEQLPIEKRRVALTTEDAIGGTVVPGAPEGRMHLKVALDAEFTASIPLNMIRRIRFVEQGR